MNKQLSTALFRSVLQAFAAAFVAYIGLNAATDNAAETAADTGVEEASQASSQPPAKDDADAAVDEAKDQGEDESSNAEFAAAAATGLVVVIGRGLGEGLFDGRRQRAGDQQPSDVGYGLEQQPLGAWVKLKGDASTFFVLTARQTSAGKTQYHVLAEGGETPRWVQEDGIEEWLFWSSSAEAH